MHSESVSSGPAFRKSVSKKYELCKIPLDFGVILAKNTILRWILQLKRTPKRFQ